MTTRPAEIAVIGMAGRFPEACDLDQFFANEAEGRDSVRSISAERIKKTALAPDGEYLVCGYLEDIDNFDYGYFQISLGEAQTMGPELRLLLEVVHETIENAGYSPAALREQRISLFLNAIYSDYHRLADEAVATLITGNAPSFIVARIARQFHFTGSAIVVDTSCSSSLSALHLACNEIAMGDVTSAIVCGANLYPIPTVKRQELLDVWSPTGKSKAFSASADGMSRGEVVAAVMLKSLDAARADGDRIRAVIRSTAINNNGTWSSSPSAPDSRSQAAVLEAAWRKAGIDPRRIGYIEAHGSGTQIGDALEIEGLNRAFRGHTTERRFCAISTGKSSLGHGMYAAGISGFIRAVLAVERGVLFPNIHFDQPNPLIDFDDSAVYVNETLAPWPTLPGEMRLAGVSSVGMSGINGHAVIEQAPPPSTSPRPCQSTRTTASTGEAVLVTISSHTAEGLSVNRERLRRWLDEHPSSALSDVAYTLNLGRTHHRFRFASVVSDLEDMRRALQGARGEKPTAVGLLDKLVLVFSDQPTLDDAWIEHFRATHPAYREAWLECEKTFARPLTERGVREAAFQYSLYRTLLAHGVESWNVLGTGVGKHVADVASGAATLTDALRQAAVHRVEVTRDLAARVQSLLAREAARHERTVFLGMGPPGPLIEELERRRGAEDAFATLSLSEPTPSRNPILELLRALYLNGSQLNWDAFGRQYPGARIELPSHCFEKTHVWIRSEPRADAAARVPPVRAEPSPSRLGSDLEQEVERAWLQVLETDVRPTPSSNFFELGGDSLAATRMVQELNTSLSIRVDFEDVFDFPTFSAFSAHVAECVTPATEVRRIWQSVLCSGYLRPTDDFFALGGHSLLATQVLSRVNQQYALRLDFEHLWSHPTLGQFAELVTREFETRRTPSPLSVEIASGPAQSHYPLSPSQRRLWLLDRLGDGSQAYHAKIAYALRGPLSVDNLARSFTDVVERHESLRTVFLEVDGEPRQRVLPVGALGCAEFEYQDLGGTGAEEAHAIAQRLLSDAAAQRLNLATGPLVRAKLLSLDPQTHVFCLFLHHIVSDGWSVAVFVRDLLSAYRAQGEGRQNGLARLPVQYRDYAQWLNERVARGDLARSRDYWLQRLGGDRPVLDLWTDHRRPPLQSFEGGLVRFRLDPRGCEGLKAYCRAQGATLFMGLYALVLGLLQRHSGQRDFLIGSPVAGRTRQILEDQIGYYANTICLRSSVDTAKTFADLLAVAKQTVVDAQRHQEFPFDRLLEALGPARDMSRAPLFDVMLILQNTADVQLGAPATVPGLKVEPFELPHSVSKFDLTFEFMDARDTIDCYLEYNRRLFERGRVEALAQDFVALCERALAQPNTPLRQLDFRERDSSLDAAATASLPPERGLPQRDSLHSALVARVAESTDAVALVEGDSHVTFGVLGRRAHQLAARLRSSGVGPEVPVAVLLERSTELIVALLGIAEAGGVYVPLDPAWPDQRLDYILRAVQPRLVLSRSGFAQRLEPSNCNARYLDSDWPSFERKGAELPFAPVHADNSLYLVYTSGSTGEPKGVLGLHGSTLERIDFILGRYPVASEDVGCLRTPIGFVDALSETLTGLLGGARSLILADDVVKDPKQFRLALQRGQVTSLTLVPSLLRSLLEAEDIDEQKLPCLRHWVVSGESLASDLAEAFRRRFPNAMLLNLYGASEVAGDSTFHEVCDGESDPVPAGQPIGRTQLHVLGAQLGAVPNGVRGELYVSGGGLARGYFDRPDLTAEAFVPNPLASMAGARMYRTGDIGGFTASGELCVLGRGDRQLKIRGCRVEPGEVEAALRAHEDLLDVAVVGVVQNGLTQLLAACVARAGKHPSSASVRHFARAKLPDYLAPARVVLLPALPHNANGKVDRRALQALAQTAQVTSAAGLSKASIALREALQEIPEISDFALTHGSDATILMLFEASNDVSVWALRKHLLPRLPVEVAPARMVQVPVLHRTADGRIDFARLRSEIGEPSECTADTEPFENRVASIWKEVLGVSELRSEDTFLDLGGDSLASVRVTSLLVQRLGADLSPRDILFQTLSQTAAACRASLERSAERPASPPTLAVGGDQR